MSRDLARKLRQAAKELEELKARRAAMAKIEWVQHEATEYEIALRVCSYCAGIRPDDFARIYSWDRSKYHEGHKADCIYLQCPTEDARGEQA